MVSKKLNIIAVFFLFCLGGLHAQQSLHQATGGDALGSGGTVSYTVGYPIYTTYIGAGGMVAQGVQHAFEILIMTGTEETLISLELDVYPNPTKGLLNLRIMDFGFQELTYLLYDGTGRLLERKRLTDGVTSINMRRFPAAIYYLRVRHHQKTMKSFKIIKY